MLRFAAVLFASLATLAQAADFYVSPGGDDSHSASASAPMRSLEAARDAARRAPAGPHRIVVLPGEYFLDRTLELDARDNGLTIEASEPGKAILYGGRRVNGWRRDGSASWYPNSPPCGKEVGLPRAGGERPPAGTRAHARIGRLPPRSTFDVPWLSSVGGVLGAQADSG